MDFASHRLVLAAGSAGSGRRALVSATVAVILAGGGAACTRPSPGGGHENKLPGTFSATAPRPHKVDGGMAGSERPALLGRVQDRLTQDIPAARVLLWREVDGGAAAPPRRTVADDQGRFQFPDVDASQGTWRLLVEAPGFPPHQGTVPPGFQAVVIHLTDEARRLTGMVTRNGAPAADATVVLGGETVQVLRLVRSAPDGGFAFTGLGPGAYTLRAVLADRASPSTGELILSRDAAVPPVNLVLAPGWTLTGRITDAALAPMADAQVKIESTRQSVGALDIVTADGSGQWTSLALPAGEYRLTPRRAGFLARGSAQISVGPGVAAPTPVLLQLVRGAELVGRVVDGHGAGVAGALVRCLVPGRVDLTVIDAPLPLAAEAAAVPASAGGVAVGPVRSVLADAAGRFALTDLLPGRVRIDASSPGRIPGRSDVFTLESGQRRDVGAVVLADGLSVSGRVVDEFDAPLEGAHVVLQAAPGAVAGAGVVAGAMQGPLFAVTGGAGQFTLSVPPGAHTLTISAPGMRAQQRVVTAQPGAPMTALDVKLVRADAALEGVVRDTGGRPVARAQITAWPGTADVADPPRPAAGASPLSATLTDAGGHFTLGRLPRGALVLEVKHAVYPSLFAWATTGTLAALTVPIPGAISGDVHEQGSGAVVSRFRVEARSPDGQIVVGRTTKKNGNGFYIGPLPPGRWTVAVDAAGYAPAQVDAEVVASAVLGEPSVRALRVDVQPSR